MSSSPCTWCVTIYLDFYLFLSAVIESFQYRGLLLHYSQIVSVFSWCEWNFFFNFLILLLQVHSSTIHSCVLFLYLAVLQNSLIPSSYLVDSLVFGYPITLAMYKSSVFFSFPVFPLFYCLALLCVSELLIKCLPEPRNAFLCTIGREVFSIHH